MEKYRFNVFGDILAIERSNSGWRCFAVGLDGKLGPVDLAVPPEITYEELPQYLYDFWQVASVLGFDGHGHDGFGDVLDLLEGGHAVLGRYRGAHYGIP